MITTKSFLIVLHQRHPSGAAEPSSFFHSEFLLLILKCIVYYFFISILSLVMVVHHGTTVGFFSFYIYGVYVLFINCSFTTVVHHTMLWEQHNCPVPFYYFLIYDYNNIACDCCASDAPSGSSTTVQFLSFWISFHYFITIYDCRASCAFYVLNEAFMLGNF